MTPFMTRVDEVLCGGTPTMDGLSFTGGPRPMGQALHKQVELRAAAEQFVSEGNALLRQHGSVLTLVDAARQDELSFTVALGQARAEVVTTVSGRDAWGCLVLQGGDRQGGELVDEDALASLILRLIASEHSVTPSP